MLSRVQRYVFWSAVVIAAGCFLLLPSVHDVEWKKFLDNVHWMAASTAAATLTYLSFRAAQSDQRRTLGWFAFGTGCYAIAQILWAIQVSANWTPFPAPSDLFYLLMPISYLLGIWTELKNKINRGEYRTIILDATILTIAANALTLAMYLPRRDLATELQFLITIAYPVLFVTALSFSLITILHARPSLDRSWILVIAGLFFNSVVWMIWNIQALEHSYTDGTLYNTIFTIAALMLGVGSATWKFEMIRSTHRFHVSDLLLRLSPIVAVIMSSVSIVACITISTMDSIVRLAIELSALLVLILSIVRQTVLVNEVAKLTSLETAILSNAGFAIIATDKKGVITAFNPYAEYMLGFSSEEMIGKVTPERFHDRNEVIQRATEFSEKLAKTILPGFGVLTAEVEAGLPSVHEWTYVCKDGRKVQVLLAVTRLTNVSGETTGFLGVAADVSKQKQAERQIMQLNADLEYRVRDRTAALELSNAELETFAYSVSHDLRSPLRGIDGFARLLGETISPQLNINQSHYLTRITAATKKMGEIIDGLLDMSRVTRTAIHPVACNLTTEIRHWIADQATRLQNRNLQWRIDETPNVFADSRLIGLLVDNLLANAVKYSGQTTEAIITFGIQDQDDRWLTLFVEDNGAGFHMAEVDRLFKPFQRLHRIEEYEGTGIGLATVHRIVQLHGGWIKAEGEPGKGAKFIFTLPLASTTR